MPYRANKPCRNCKRPFVVERRSLRGRMYCSALCNDRRYKALFEHRRYLRFAPTKRPTIKDIAWAAGLFEGEGTVHRKNSNVAANICQTDPWIIERLRTLFGGHIIEYQPKKARHSYMWRWQVNGPRAMAFMLTIYSFLSPWRKEQFGMAYFPTVSM